MDPERELAEKLLAAALEVKEQAYAPYSGFRVGAALLTKDGDVFVGCNVENSSYSLTCCAERSALFTAVSAGASEFHAIAIASDGDPVPPCGACRQVLSEFAPELTVIFGGSTGEIRTLSLINLLPEPFSGDYFKK